MRLHPYFELSRFWWLLKIELFRHRKATGITLVVIFGMLFFIGMVLDILIDPTKTQYTHEQNYVSALLTGGFILSSLAFRDLSHTLRKQTYLVLPASTLEKFLSMWLLTSVGWMLVFTLLYMLYVPLANAAGGLLFHSISFQAFYPLHETPWTAMKLYMVLQSFFLVGAVHFEGYVFPKTVSVGVALALVIVLLLFLLLKDVFRSDHRCDANGCELVEAALLHPAWLVTRWLFWWVLAPLCWVITYLGLKDKEV